jgi:hypothetical protein
VWELKYVKGKDKDNKKLISDKKAEALEQLRRYQESVMFKHRTDVRYLVVVFVGGDRFEIEDL